MNAGWQCFCVWLQSPSLFHLWRSLCASSFACSYQPLGENNNKREIQSAAPKQFFFLLQLDDFYLLSAPGATVLQRHTRGLWSRLTGDLFSHGLLPDTCEAKPDLVYHGIMNKARLYVGHCMCFCGWDYLTLENVFHKPGCAYMCVCGGGRAQVYTPVHPKSLRTTA